MLASPLVCHNSRYTVLPCVANGPLILTTGPSCLAKFAATSGWSLARWSSYQQSSVAQCGCRSWLHPPRCDSAWDGSHPWDPNQCQDGRRWRSTPEKANGDATSTGPGVTRINNLVGCPISYWCLSMLIPCPKKPGWADNCAPSQYDWTQLEWRWLVCSFGAGSWASVTIMLLKQVSYT